MIQEQAVEREPSEEMWRVLTEMSVRGPLELRDDRCYHAGIDVAPCEEPVLDALLAREYIVRRNDAYHLTERGRRIERKMFAKYEGRAEDEQAPSTIR